MKNYRITVNGNTYDVAVEELGADAVSSTPVAPTPAPKTAPAPKVAPAGSQGSIKVKAPMPGNIVDVKVSVGDKIEANAVVAVLEAMKMENEITSPNAGTVVSVNVTKGATVNTDDILVTLSE